MFPFQQDYIGSNSVHQKKKMTQTHLVYSIKMPQGNLHTGGKWICAEKS